jgi:hypothetical protein
MLGIQGISRRESLSRRGLVKITSLVFLSESGEHYKDLKGLIMPFNEEPHKAIQGPSNSISGPYKAVKEPYKVLQRLFKALKSLIRPCYECIVFLCD